MDQDSFDRIGVRSSRIWNGAYRHLEAAKHHTWVSRTAGLIERIDEKLEHRIRKAVDDVKNGDGYPG